MLRPSSAVVYAINGRGDPFLRGLERYRSTANRIENDDQKITALLNYFDFGKQIYQFDFLKTASLNSMCDEYLRILPLINKIDDFSNKLILSKISKEDAYTFASELQDVIDDLAQACDKYYGHRPPEFQGRTYIEVRAVFIAPALINVEHNFDTLLEHKNNNTLHNVSLTEYRVPSNFGALSNFK